MDSAGIGLASRPTFGGLATGLDSGALIEQLIAVERLPLRRLEDRKDGIEAQKSLLRDFNSKLLQLRNAARDIDNRTLLGGGATADEELIRFKTGSTDEEKVTATANGFAKPGEIEIEVERLATFGREFSTTFADSNTAVALAQGQSATFTTGKGDTFTVTAASDLTLDKLSTAINAHVDNTELVRASVLFDGTNYRLVTSAGETGVENDITITGSLSIDAILEQQAVDSRVHLFGPAGTGIQVERPTNSIDDALAGITFELHETTLGLTERISVEIDGDAIAERLDTFVSTYNAVLSFVDKEFSSDPETGARGPLAGDSTLLSIRNQIRNVVGSLYNFTANPSNPFASASDLGIQAGGDGKLSIDREILDDALARDPGGVSQLLSGLDDGSGTFEEGVATRISSILEPLVRFGDGIMASRDEGLKDRVETLEEQILRFQVRLQKREEGLVRRFSELESVVAALLGQSGFLASLGKS